MTYWDSLREGAIQDLGSHRFEADEIKRFAASYDPQSFHLDEEAARRSVLGGLCASGWHTASVFMRLNVEFAGSAARRWVEAGGTTPRFGPSPGVKNLRWLRPVFAGDTIAFRQRIVAKRLSASRPGWGICETRADAANEGGEPVFAMDAAVFVGID